MVNFSALRTRRLSVLLREISIADAIRLASVPASRFEAGTTDFLTRVVEKAYAQTAAQVADPRAWTVQERMFVVGHYLAHVSDDGPDFAVGGGGRYSSYLDTAKDVPPQASEAYEVGGDKWHLVPLIGAAAEAIENLQGGMGDSISGRFHWLVGAMGAQLRRGDEEVPDAVADPSAFADWLQQRIHVFYGYPESDFVQLLAAFKFGQRDLDHLFQIEFDDQGVIVMPVNEAEAGESALPPARFPVGSCISDFAKDLVGKLE